MSESQTGRCLVATVGSRERFQVASDHAAVTAHWVDTGMPANNSSPLAGCAATTSCQLTVGWPPAGTRTSVLFLLGAGSDFGTYDYQAQLTCLTAPCGAQAYGISAVSPANLLAGDTVTLTMTGAAFDTSDAVKLAKAGSPAIVATVQGVSADRHTLTAVADLTGATAGTWTVTATSPLAGTSGSWTGLAVTLPKITARAVPAITGSVKVGSAIHATTGTWSPDATSFSYQWSSDGVAIRGATGSAYVVPAAQRGHRLTVTARLAGHTDGRSVSAAKVVATGDAPRATKAPWITGTVKTKHAVRVSVGSWTPKPDGYRYEWRLNGKLIKGATKASLKITSKMAGHELTVTVIAKKAGHNDGRRTSASIKVKR